MTHQELELRVQGRDNVGYLVLLAAFGERIIALLGNASTPQIDQFIRWLFAQDPKMMAVMGHLVREDSAARLVVHTALRHAGESLGDAWFHQMSDDVFTWLGKEDE